MAGNGDVDDGYDVGKNEHCDSGDKSYDFGYDDACNEDVEYDSFVLMSMVIKMGIVEVMMVLVMAIVSVLVILLTFVAKIKMIKRLSVFPMIVVETERY